jgi:hypothetical protein
MRFNYQGRTYVQKPCKFFRRCMHFQPHKTGACNYMHIWVHEWQHACILLFRCTAFTATKKIHVFSFRLSCVFVRTTIFTMKRRIMRRPMLRTIVHDAIVHISMQRSSFGKGLTTPSHTTCAWKTVFVRSSLPPMAKSWATRTSKVVKY